MRAVVQRVRKASVTLKDTGERREIGAGIVVLLAVAPNDTDVQVKWLANKIIGLRLFEDSDGKMNLSLEDIPRTEILVVSQFTLYGDATKGRRPSFIDAAPPAIAIPLYEQFIAAMSESKVPIQTGDFGADMLVEIANDGPVTLIIDTPSL